MTDAVLPVPEEDGQPDEIQLSQWEFIDPRKPTAEAVTELLTKLPKVWGVATVDFIDFVQPLPQKKKVRRVPENGGPVMQQTVDAWTLYTSVAGRQKMLNAAQEEHGWTVEFIPEPKTPTGVPGLIRMDEVILYREYLQITDVEGRLIGSRPGMAWIPDVGRSNASLTNPFEKVETSARGRSLGAWGFGVLPGSGIASLEEMLGAAQNERQAQRRQQYGAPQPYGPGGSVPGTPPVDRANVLQECMTLVEQLRQMRKQSVEDSNDRMSKVLKDRFGVPAGDNDLINWSALNAGQLGLVLGDLRTSIEWEHDNAVRLQREQQTSI